MVTKIGILSIFLFVGVVLLFGCIQNPVCGNNVCEMGEDSVTCPMDCPINPTVCGNNICEKGEDAVNCAIDCAQTQKGDLKITIVPGAGTIDADLAYLEGKYLQVCSAAPIDTNSTANPCTMEPINQRTVVLNQYPVGKYDVYFNEYTATDISVVPVSVPTTQVFVESSSPNATHADVNALLGMTLEFSVSAKDANVYLDANKVFMISSCSYDTLSMSALTAPSCYPYDAGATWGSTVGKNPYAASATLYSADQIPQLTTRFSVLSLEYNGLKQDSLFSYQQGRNVINFVFDKNKGNYQDAFVGTPVIVTGTNAYANSKLVLTLEDIVKVPDVGLQAKYSLKVDGNVVKIVQVKIGTDLKTVFSDPKGQTAFKESVVLKGIEYYTAMQVYYSTLAVTLPVTFSCVDSDVNTSYPTGLNYFQKGSALVSPTDANHVSAFDACTTTELGAPITSGSDGVFVTEAYCNGTTAAVTSYKCSLGCNSTATACYSQKPGVLVYAPFDNNIVTNLMGGDITAVNGGITFTSGHRVKDSGVYLDGTHAITLTKKDGSSPAMNTFSLVFWVKTAATHEIDRESINGVLGTSGQKYVFGADYKGTEAGLGVSVGTNGVSVYEHGDYYLPAVAVYSGNMGTGWNQVAVVYAAKKASIYVNGALVRTGLTSNKTNVYAPTSIGVGSYGNFTGVIDEVLVYSYALNAQNVTDLYTASKP